MEEDTERQRQVQEALGVLAGVARELGAASVVARLEDPPPSRGLATAVGLAAATLLDQALVVRASAEEAGASALARRLDELDAGQPEGAARIEAGKTALQEEARRLKAKVRGDLDAFCRDVAASLPATVDGARAMTLKTHLGPYLDDAFQRWAEAELAEMQEAMDALARTTAERLEADAAAVDGKLEAALGSRVAVPPLEVDTFGYDLGVVAMLSFGVGVVFANLLLGGALLAGAPLLALWSRERADANLRARIIAEVPAALKEAASRATPRFEALIDAAVARLEAWVDGVGAGRSRAFVEVLRRLEEEAGEDDDLVDLGTLREAVARARAKLAGS